ncbi:BTA121 domain-containing protein surface lipoprotein [Borrelia miyamotoi]|uniref:BTA121 domain-containing protein surface lipoprotein n=1 Tax=Borrelia miyamotoi TaxID=47466 RepID=UPI0039E17C7C
MHPKDDQYTVTHTKENFDNFLLHLGVVKLREILIPIMQTLAAKKEVETALLKYNGSRKNEFEQKLKEEEALYLNMLKLDANSDSFDTMYNSLVKNSNAYKFMYLKSVIGTF